MQDFGRFPHRNAILGRKSTEKEMEALNGMSFNPLTNKESNDQSENAKMALAVLAGAVVIGMVWYIVKRR